MCTCHFILLVGSNYQIQDIRFRGNCLYSAISLALISYATKQVMATIHLLPINLLSRTHKVKGELTSILA